MTVEVLNTLQNPKVILVDLDGTMVDSVPDLAYCVDEMMARLDMPKRGEDSVRLWVGNGVEKLVKRALVNDLDKEPEEALFLKARDIFMDLYQDNTAGRSCVYPGIKPGLETLKAKGYNLACVTNKAARFTEPLLEQLGLSHYFETIISGDTLPVKKPDPGPLFYASGFFRTHPSQCLMVGDSQSDVKAARAAGFQIACMRYGYNHGQDIRLFNPDVLLDSLEEILPLLG